MSFPVVGIGASAGGLEAVSELLTDLPSPTGAAFLLVQHLDPEHSSLLPEILAKKTRLTVSPARDGTSLESDHLYVIPPNAVLTLADGVLRLGSRQTDEERHAPIDILLNSLAEECGHNAIGVILSGTGSDGTRGVQNIKESGGIIFAQDAASARFASMPKSAVETGCVDFVLTPKEIARELMRIVRHPYLSSNASPSGATPSLEEHHLKTILQLLLDQGGVDFTHYKRSTIQRRVERRLALHHLKGLAEYANLLHQDPAEMKALSRDFLINVTGFFRDPESFTALTETVFPALLEHSSPKEPLRVWVPGCATGDEVYSIAISLIEFLENRTDAPAIQIFGTDLSEPAIEKARRGEYPKSIVREVSTERLKRFFVKIDQRYQISKSIRDLCIFARQDVAHDPPFSRLGLVSCRNVLIYLGQPSQQRILRLFHYALRPRGFLMLGQSETVGQSSDLYQLIDARNKIYRKQALATDLIDGEGPMWNAQPRAFGGGAVTGIPAPAGKDRVQKETERLLLARYAPACVLIEENLNVLYFHGETGRYLEHAGGPASLNLQKLVRPGFLVQLNDAIKEVREGNALVSRDAVPVELPGGMRKVRFEVMPIKIPDLDQLCYLILFEQPQSRVEQRHRSGWLSKWMANLPWGAEATDNERVPQIQRELEATREYLKTIVEEHEAAKEELQSANEELATANEEFQSTNEELETAKEELESTNEELATTNDELGTRNHELNDLNEALKQSHDYLDAIFETMREPLLVLDAQLRIKKANHAFHEFFKTPREETEGCFLYDLANGQWNIPALRQLLGQILPKKTVLRDYEVSQSFAGIGTRTLVLNARRLSRSEQDEELILLAIEDVTEHAAALYAITDRRKDEFLAMLAHELRNPLAPIRNALAVLRMDSTNTAGARQHDIIERQLQDLVRLVDDLLDAGRITRGDIVLKKEPVDLAEIVNQVVEATRQQLDEKQHRLALSLPNTSTTVGADPTRLKQIVANLLSNAIKYTEPGGRIGITIERRDDEAVLSVNDTGIGMDQETLSHLYDLFFQSNTSFSRSQGGLGIGLTLVKRLVDLHGGRVEASSDGLGKGSNFIVRLPLLPSSEPPVESVETPAVESHLKRSKSRRILIVDDNQDAAETLGLIVESWGYQTAVAHDGPSALGVAKDFQPEIGLLDVGLPGMDGFELGKRLRELPGMHKLHLIAITGYGRDQDREAAHQAGFDRLLVKPLDPERLAPLLETLN